MKEQLAYNLGVQLALLEKRGVEAYKGKAPDFIPNDSFMDKLKNLFDSKFHTENTRNHFSSNKSFGREGYEEFVQPGEGTNQFKVTRQYLPHYEQTTVDTSKALDSNEAKKIIQDTSKNITKNWALGGGGIGGL